MDALKPVFYASQSWPAMSSFFFPANTLCLKPLSLSFSSLLTWSLHLWIKPTTSMAGASKLNTSHQSRGLSLLPNDSFFFPQPLLSSLSFLISLFGLYSLMCFCLCLVVQWLWSGDCGQEAQWWFDNCSHEAWWWCGSNLVGFVGWFGGSRYWSSGSWVWFGGWVGRC